MRSFLQNTRWIIALFLLCLLFLRWQQGWCQADTSRTLTPLRHLSSQGITGLVGTTDGGTTMGGRIALLRTDSTVMAQAIVGDNGTFQLAPQPPGQYLVRGTSLGYQTYWTTVLLSDSARTNTLPIRLTAQELKLAEVTVKQKKAVYEISGDRIILNTDQNPAFAGGSTLAALSLSPRLQVDPLNKGITLDGKTGVQLVQDGKQLNYTQSQLINYLQNLPVTTISRIEILTVPSARYDAAGGFVILLTTRRSTQQGFTGDLAIMGGVGRFPKASIALNGTYRTEKLTLTGLYTPTYRPTYSEYVGRQSLAPARTGQAGYTLSNQYQQDDVLNHTLRLGGDWQVNPRMSVGFVAQGGVGYANERPASTIRYRPVDAASETQLTSATDYAKHQSSLLLNINLRQSMGKSHQLTADLDWGRYGDNNRLFTSYVSSPMTATAPMQSVGITYPNNVLFQTARVDLTGPLGSRTQLETGVKLTAITMTNTPQLALVTDAFTPLLTQLTQPYRFDETTQAVYGSLSQQRKQWTAQGGLRVEHTIYTGQSSANFQVHQDYTNLFPSLSVQYTTPNKQQWSLAANRRLVRPSFELLNPAYIFIDPVTLFSGNPRLRPQYATTLQATYTTAKRISLTAVYTLTRQRLTQVIYRGDSLSPLLTNTTINFNEDQRWGLTLVWPQQITKHWQLLGSASAVHLDFLANDDIARLRLSQNTVSARLVNTLAYGKLSFTGSVVYRSRTVLGLLSYDPLWYLDAGGQYTINERSSLKLAATDLFHTLLINNYGTYGTTDVAFRHRSETQQVLLTYTHKLGSKTVKKAALRSGGSDTEQERIRR